MNCCIHLNEFMSQKEGMCYNFEHCFYISNFLGHFVARPPDNNVQTSAMVSSVPRDVKQDVDCSTPTVGLGFVRTLLGSPAHPPPPRHLSVRIGMTASGLD